MSIYFWGPWLKLLCIRRSSLEKQTQWGVNAHICHSDEAAARSLWKNEIARWNYFGAKKWKTTQFFHNMHFYGHFKNFLYVWVCACRERKRQRKRERETKREFKGTSSPNCGFKSKIHRGVQRHTGELSPFGPAAIYGQNFLFLRRHRTFFHEGSLLNVNWLHCWPRVTISSQKHPE